MKKINKSKKKNEQNYKIEERKTEGNLKKKNKGK